MDAVCVVRLPEAGWVRVAGEDRVRWLNGMVTNSIKALEVGEGCFNYLLNAQGRIQGTAFAFAEADAVLLETDRAQVEPMLAMLDRFIIMDDVELVDASAEWTGLLVVGPGSEEMLRGVGLMPEGVGTPGFATLSWRGAVVRVQRMPGTVAPRFELWATEEIAARLLEELTGVGAVAGEGESLEWLRLLEGTPKFGVDIRDRELPQETGQTEALHFSKGCYLGQEIVERIRSRGAVHRVFGGFRLEGTPKAVPAALTAGGKPVGELTSFGRVPAVAGLPDGMVVGLGYCRREVLDSKQEIGFEGGVAVPVTLPIRAADRV